VLNNYKLLKHDPGVVGADLSARCDKPHLQRTKFFWIAILAMTEED
jgi:hypothetical protein